MPPDRQIAASGTVGASIPHLGFVATVIQPDNESVQVAWPVFSVISHGIVKEKLYAQLVLERDANHK